MAMVFLACQNQPKTPKNSLKTSAPEQEFKNKAAAMRKKASEITQQMCANYPEDLVLQFNPDAKRVVVETIERIPGQMAPCKVKLFYGDKAHEFWEGNIGVWYANGIDAFRQYNPKRSPSAYEAVTQFGQKGVYIKATNQLLVQKDDLVYTVAAPCRRGQTTSNGMLIKDLVFALAKHYQL